MNLKCSCGSDEFTFSLVVLANQTEHKVAHCIRCEKRYPNFLPKELTPENLDSWTMPFGKHAGKRLAEIPRDYLLWCLDNVPRNNIQKTLKAYLDQQVKASPE